MGVLGGISEVCHASPGPLTSDRPPGTGLPASPAHG